MKYIRLVIIAALIHATASASPFTITCQTYNASTSQLQTTFQPGDTVLVVVTTSYPNATAAHKEMSLTVMASAKISGITIPFKVIDSNSFPNTNPTATGSPALLQSGTESRSFKIPSMLPNTAVKVTARASIKDVGKAGCVAKIAVISGS